MDEEGRKALQRQKQRAALKRQQEGGLSKKEIKRRRAAGEELPKLPKKTKKVHERESWKQSDERKAAAALGNDGGDGGDGERPRHDLVVIPIFWRNIPGQEEAMVAEAHRIKDILHSLGRLDVWVDRTHKRTPGQKLNFWEAQGVRWRVEVGPKDAAKQKCVLSHQAGEAGDYSTVTKIQGVSSVKRHVLLSKLRDTLRMEKIPEAAIERAREDEEGDRREKEKALQIMQSLNDDAAAAAAAAADDDDDDDDDDDNQGEEGGASATASKPKKRSGSSGSSEPNAKERRAARRKHLQEQSDQ